MAKKYRVYGIASASKYMGEFEAGSKEEAEEIAWKEGDYHIGLCHHCAGEIDIGDIYEVQVEEV